MFITQLEGISGTCKSILKEVESSSEIWPPKYPWRSRDMISDANVHLSTSDRKVRALQELQLNEKKATFAEQGSQFFQARYKQVL